MYAVTPTIYCGDCDEVVDILSTIAFDSIAEANAAMAALEAQVRDVTLGLCDVVFHVEG